MPEVPTFIVSPRIQTTLGEQLLIEPLPSCGLEQRLRRDAEGLACQRVPVGRVFTVGKEQFLYNRMSPVYFLLYGANASRRGLP
jgi:hypothetical protein